ncbi:MAG: preprotein translocase subunit SecG [Mycoplasmataceae bacterium]|jgi:preprotein translocase subunit SecG|nr:preprotein translocase subunit SecG [Mycoplasmataceae bacterium]
MTTPVIIILLISIVCLIIGLLLSGSGSTTGLTAMSGQDLELFKKTKDRGFVKIMQIIMFLLVIGLLALVIVVHILGL